jgi:thiamine-phosphate pyrophosphorylase
VSNASAQLWDLERLIFPKFYPILDASWLPAEADERREALSRAVRSLAQAGVRMLQFRYKQASEDRLLADAAVMRAAAPPELRLILNDWPALAVKAGFDGVHVGQTDASPSQARAIVGPQNMVGISTHNAAQLSQADAAPVDYIAIGPVFATSTKQNPDPVVGIAGVALARTLTHRPLVAIGGITPANAAKVLAAGADAVAVVSAIFSPGSDPVKSAGDFLRVCR